MNHFVKKNKKTVACYTQVIEVSQEDLELANEVLSVEEGYYEEAEDDEIIQEWSCEFDTPYGKYGIEIKLCNGEPPYIDPVLYRIKPEENREVWVEAGMLDVCEELLGEYMFELEEKDVILKFQVQVVAK